MRKKRETVKLNEHLAKLIAIDYINNNLRNNNFEYKLVEITGSEDTQYWTVIIDAFTPDGHLIDGPLVLKIDKIFGKIWSFDEWLNLEK